MFSQLSDTVQKNITQLLLNNQFPLAKKLYEKNVCERYHSENSPGSFGVRDRMSTGMVNNPVSFALHRVLVVGSDQVLGEQHDSIIKIFFICVYFFISYC